MFEAASFFVVDPNDRRKHQHRLHQDHASFFWGEDHLHYLNLYMIVEKAAGDANIDVVPFDLLNQCSADLLHVIEGGGATRFMHRHDSAKHFASTPEGAETVLVDDNHGYRLAIDFPVESLACSPDLMPGDLFIMRGDTMHRTGTFHKGRIALSVRVRDLHTDVRADQLLSGRLVKARHLIEDVDNHAQVLG